jgi:hypothetical protein
MQTNTNNTKRVSLSSVVSSVLQKAGPKGISVNLAVQAVETIAKELDLVAKINYRSVYQQLKNLGCQAGKGVFVSKQETPLEEIAA